MKKAIGQEWVRSVAGNEKTSSAAARLINSLGNVEPERYHPWAHEILSGGDPREVSVESPNPAVAALAGAYLTCAKFAGDTVFVEFWSMVSRAEFFLLCQQ